MATALSCTGCGPVVEPRINEQTPARAIEFLKQPEWHDFGPTFAREQLGKRHGIQVSKELVRAWRWHGSIESSDLQTQRRALLAQATERVRREALRYLVRMIDDATSRSTGSFMQHARTRENMACCAASGAPGPRGGCIRGSGRDLHGDATSGRKRAAAPRIGPIDTKSKVKTMQAVRRYQLVREQRKAGMRGSSVGIELP